MRYYFVFVCILFSSMVVCNAEECCSLRTNTANMRIGPSNIYDVKSIYIKRHTPFIILRKFGSWIEVRDIEGVSGWISSKMLCTKNYAMTRCNKENEKILFYSKSSQDEKNDKIKFTTECKAIVHVITCNASRCLSNISGHKGWINRENLWCAHKE